jgi:hypothetical protein
MLKYLFVFALVSGPAFAACDSNDVVTYGATGGATIDGRPIITLEGAGGVTINRKGGPGSFITAVECDRVAATEIRARLSAELEGDSFTAVAIPVWLQN